MTIDEPCDLLKEPWYVVGPPWGAGDFIRAGAEDAAGTYVCGIEDAVWDIGDQLQHYGDVLSYICQLHNDRLREPARQLALADARVAKAEQELAHLRNAHDVLFETHQREMDRLHAEVTRLRAELHTERTKHHGRYAFLHRHYAMMYVRQRDGALHDWAASEAGRKIDRDGAQTYEDYVTRLETALRDLLTGAEQGSQSAVDVATKCRAALGEALCQKS